MKEFPIANASEPAVDVVVATRDRARFLTECLASVRAQTHQPRRVIVVDDGSTDDTTETLSRLGWDWPELIAISVAPGGVSAARNRGLREVRSELVAFVDDDDLWAPSMLERQAGLFRARPDLGFAYCGFRELDVRGYDLPRGHCVSPTKRGDIFHDILEGFLAIAISTVVARRDVLFDVGGFDESLVQAEDRDLCLAIARRCAIDCTPDILVGLRKHARGAHSSTMRTNPECVLFQRLAVWDKWRDDIRDRESVLNRFRAEAATVAVHLLAKPRPDLGLYERLRQSDVALARELFPTRGAYVATILAWFGIGRLPASAGSSLPDKMKGALARNVILPSPALLSMARRLGKFKDIPGSAPPERDGT